MGGVAEAFSTALIRFTSQDHLGRVEMERIVNAALHLEEVMARLRERGFDDFPGGAPLLAAVTKVVEVAEPVRCKIKQFLSIDDYLAALREGKAALIPYLTERYDEEAMRKEVLQTEAKL